MWQEPLGLNPVPPVLEPEAWGKTWVNPSRLSGAPAPLNIALFSILCTPGTPLPPFPRMEKAPPLAGSSPVGRAVARSAEPRGDDSSCGAGGKEAEDKWMRGPGSMVSTAFLQASPASLPQEYGGACGKGVQELGKA